MKNESSNFLDLKSKIILAKLVSGEIVITEGEFLENGELYRIVNPLIIQIIPKQSQIVSNNTINIQYTLIPIFGIFTSYQDKCYIDKEKVLCYKEANSELIEEYTKIYKKVELYSSNKTKMLLLENQNT